MKRSIPIRPVVVFFLSLLWNFFSSETISGQTQTIPDQVKPDSAFENSPTLEITQGWMYLWGDSPVDEQQVPVWTYEENPEWQPIGYSGFVGDPLNRNGQHNLWLRVPLPEGNWQEPCLYIESIGFACEVYLDNKQIYKYGSITKPGDGKYKGPRYHLISLPPMYQGQKVFFRIYSEQPKSIGLKGVKLLARSDFLETLITNELQPIAFGFLFLAIGLFFLLLFIIKRKQKTYFTFGLFSFSIGIWVLIGYKLLQLIFPTTGNWFYLTVPFQYVAMAALCAYFVQIFNLGKKSFIHRMQQFYLVYAAVAFTLHLTHLLPLFVVSLMEILFILFLGITFIILSITSIKAALKGKTEAKIITGGFAIFSVIVLFDILAGFVDAFLWAYDLSVWGMLAFIFSLGLVLERRFTEAHDRLQHYSSELEVQVNEKTKAAEALQNALAEVEKLKNRLQTENVYLQEEIKVEHNFGDIIGQSDALKKVLNNLEQVASTDATVLVLGESGTGKELLARAIHNISQRGERPLVKVNCAALPANLIESELFGHEKGAFTGALSRKTGRFEGADGGTIFLDEIGDLPLELQSKLLRVLQEGEIDRLGNSHAIKVDVRVIAATNRNLEEEIEKGNFREDLYYRLNVFPIKAPPLRERKEDIPLLVNQFVKKYSAKTGKKIEAIPQNVMDTLQTYHWPGNVRELENIIERAVILTKTKHLQLGDWFTKAQNGVNAKKIPTIEELEKSHIIEVLEQTNWRIRGEKGAAKILDIKPTTLASRMQKLGISRN